MSLSSLELEVHTELGPYLDSASSHLCDPGYIDTPLWALVSEKNTGSTAWPLAQTVMSRSGLSPCLVVQNPTVFAFTVNTSYFWAFSPRNPIPNKHLSYFLTQKAPQNIILQGLNRAERHPKWSVLGFLTLKDTLTILSQVSISDPTLPCGGSGLTDSHGTTWGGEPSSSGSFSSTLNFGNRNNSPLNLNSSDYIHPTLHANLLITENDTSLP